jgi:hypothetical protein
MKNFQIDPKNILTREEKRNIMAGEKDYLQCFQNCTLSCLVNCDNSDAWCAGYCNPLCGSICGNGD